MNCSWNFKAEIIEQMSYVCEWKDQLVVISLEVRAYS